MSRDERAVAEASALLACIRVTEDPVEQNRLWSRYYRLSDEIFPEAAALRKRYQSLQGDERRRFKQEYMELVRRLWTLIDPKAAYEGTFGAGPPADIRRPAPPRPRRRGTYRWARVAVLALVVAAGGFAFWHQRAPERPLEIVGSSPSDVVPDTIAAPPAVPTVSDDPGPATSPPPEAVPLAEIEAEVASEIRPEFAPVAPGLKGRGDRLVHEDRRYEDVYIIETDSLYYVRVPALGAVESVEKDGARAIISDDTAVRDALLELWKENREEIERVGAAREKEMAVRIAAYRQELDRAAARRKEAQEASRREARGGEWAALTPDQRHSARVRAYSNWKSIQGDAAKLQDLYMNISLAYELIGISDARMGRLNAAYAKAERMVGPDFDVEDALIMYGWDREELLRNVAEWEGEYYRLLEYVEKHYPEHEARVREIDQLDSFLPAEVRLAESAIDWESELAPDTAGGIVTGGVGTGFAVAEGHVMTCAHVVRSGNNITATSTDGTVYTASVVTMDSANDWALLRVEGLTGGAIPMSPEKPNVGATIYCMGYPLGGIKDSADPIVGSGNIAALQRLDGDDRFMQITAPLNPGNSGGPVLDQYGRWIGIVSQKLNDMETLRRDQFVTQGVNYAVKASFIKPLLDPGAGVKLAGETAPADTPLSLETIARQVSPSIVRIDVR